MLHVGGPVCLLILIKVLLISGGISGVATRLGESAAATHTVMFALLIFSGTFGDTISQTGQAFMPSFLGRPADAFAFAKQLLRLALAVGIVNAVCASIIPLVLPRLFTSDALVAAGMRHLAPVMFATLVLHCSSLATEGLLLAARDLGFLLRSYLLNCAVCFASLWFVSGTDLPRVWSVLVLFSLQRLVMNMGRLFVSADSPLRVASLLNDGSAK